MACVPSYKAPGTLSHLGTFACRSFLMSWFLNGEHTLYAVLSEAVACACDAVKEEAPLARCRDRGPPRTTTGAGAGAGTGPRFLLLV